MGYCYKESRVEVNFFLRKPSFGVSTNIDVCYLPICRISGIEKGGFGSFSSKPSQRGSLGNPNSGQ